MGINSVTLISNWQLTQVDKTLIFPYAPIPSASSLGVGFGYLHTFSQGIWSTRGEYGVYQYADHTLQTRFRNTHISYDWNNMKNTVHKQRLKTI